MVDLKEPKLMLRDLSGEKLDEVHASGYYDYLDCPEYVDNVLGAAARMICKHGGPNARVLDVGCGTGSLLGEIWKIPTCIGPYYLGFDASGDAIKKARLKHDSDEAFFVARVEEYCDEGQAAPVMAEILHFGGVLNCLIHPDKRLALVERYVESFQARFIVISDLERLDSAPFKERFELLEGETFHLKMPDQPDSKQHRRVEIFATGVKRDG